MKKRLTENMVFHTSGLKLLTILMILTLVISGCTPKVQEVERDGHDVRTASAAEAGENTGSSFAAEAAAISPTLAVKTTDDVFSPSPTGIFVSPSPASFAAPEASVTQSAAPSPDASTASPTVTAPSITSVPTDSSVPSAPSVPASAENQAASDKETAQPDRTSSQVTLLAVGDNLIHSQIVRSGKQSDGTYNYDHLYTNLKDEISAADIAVINQETIFGGKQLGYSGYPNFNSPAEIGDAVIDAGFDVVLHATNHTMDQGLSGVKNDIAYWKLHPEITVLGINETKEQREEIPVIEKNGIKIAMLNYTYGLNGHTVPKNKPWLVDMLDKPSMEKDIKKARESADFVIVFPHWGTEYVYEPTKTQKDLTQFFYEQGVDLIIGAHPHVLEPVEWIGAGGSHHMLVYYSLGNFISYQREAPRMLGGIAKLTITKDEKGTYISDAGITPIVTHYENGPRDYHYAIYRLTQYSEKLAGVHGILKLERKSKFSYQGTYDLAQQILGTWFQPTKAAMANIKAKTEEPEYMPR